MSTQKYSKMMKNKLSFIKFVFSSKLDLFLKHKFFVIKNIYLVMKLYYFCHKKYIFNDKMIDLVTNAC